MINIKKINLKSALILLFSCGLLTPSISIANPQIAKSNPEKLIGAVDLDNDFSKIPGKLKPLYGSPKEPNSDTCPKGPDFFGHGQKMCSYKAENGIIYRINNLGKIYEISLSPNAIGQWPQKLPLGIKTNFYRDKLHEYLYSIGIVPWRYTVFHDLEYLRDACYFTTDINNNVAKDKKMVCFIYDAEKNNKKKKIVKMVIFYNEKYGTNENY